MIKKINGITRVGLVILWLSAEVSVRANPIVPGPAAATLSPLAPTGVAGFMQVLFALIIVIASIFAALWVLKRVSGGAMGAGQRIRLVSGTMVGPKERVVIVDVEGKWLVLGVTASSVNLLHTLDKPQEEVEPENPDSFAMRMSQVLRKVHVRNPQAEREPS